jgi:sugar phosphate isomerase/epimerase
MRLGVKAALGDAREMAALDVELLEVHLGLEDIPRRTEALTSTFDAIRRERGLDILVHAPEFMGPPSCPELVDLSSPDDGARVLSLELLGRTIDLARALGSHLIIAHPGGIAPEERAARSRCEGLDRLERSLAPLRDRARDAGVLLTLENMPWFYFVKREEGVAPDGRGRRWVSTILVEPDDMDRLCDHVDGLTLDVSHGYLHDHEGGMAAIDGFLSRHKSRVLHLHLSDALPPDNEGLQVGEGCVDFASVLRALRGRDVTAVPEVIGGHRLGGRGFKRALEVLRRMLDEA